MLSAAYEGLKNDAHHAFVRLRHVFNNPYTEAQAILDVVRDDVFRYTAMVLCLVVAARWFATFLESSRAAEAVRIKNHVVAKYRERGWWDDVIGSPLVEAAQAERSRSVERTEQQKRGRSPGGNIFQKQS